ncbi:hypothetical protein DID88_008508 [Monilinia fructigena]|uniref:Uncharacterized protein n=1 Tax=Monilinia fructigena TaxID=38457 RepID=A0A395J5P7_9HELO|nr:hypothetical protein DID88_008508 [Monilinia fructigena]
MTVVLHFLSVGVHLLLNLQHLHQLSCLHHNLLPIKLRLLHANHAHLPSAVARSIERSEFSPPPTASSTSSGNDDKSDKKSSRTSRMMKRMSSSLSSSRKAIAHAISPTVREESEPPVFPDPGTSSVPSQSLTASPTTAHDLGDVNVQFLIVSYGSEQHEDFTSVNSELLKFQMLICKNYLTVFVLAFLEGGELQIACEDRTSQTNTLSVLRETHGHWASYGQ